MLYKSVVLLHFVNGTNRFSCRSSPRSLQLDCCQYLMKFIQSTVVVLRPLDIAIKNILLVKWFCLFCCCCFESVYNMGCLKFTPLVPCALRLTRALLGSPITPSSFAVQSKRQAKYITKKMSQQAEIPSFAPQMFFNSNSNLFGSVLLSRRNSGMTTINVRHVQQDANGFFFLTFRWKYAMYSEQKYKCNNVK